MFVPSGTGRAEVRLPCGMARQLHKNSLTRVMSCRSFLCLAVAFASAAGTFRAYAWDYEGHRLVNRLALAALPDEFPSFIKSVTQVERTSFLSGEPDRWRNVPDLSMAHSGGSWTDHFLDLEYLPEAGIDVETLTSFRFDFVVQFAAGRAANAQNFAPIDPAKNRDHTQEWPGFAPWAITEYFGRLRSGFSYLKVYEELGTPDEVLNAQANIIYVMGIMAHYVGDCAQPLHTTKHYNGWSGDNPNDYTRWNGIHSLADGFPTKAGFEFGQLAPRLEAAKPVALLSRSDGRDPMFVAVLDFIRAQNSQVGPLYQLEKDGKFRTGVMTDEARAFFEARILQGSQMLASIWLTAYRSAVPDTFLRSALIRRATAETTRDATAKGKP